MGSYQVQGIQVEGYENQREVQQMVLIKEEAPEVRMLGVDQQATETLNIKEEEEELWSSQEGEQFCVKKETDDTGFSFTAVHLKREEDEEKPQFLQLHQYQVKEEDLPTSSSADQMKPATGGEDYGGAETTRNPDLHTYGDDYSSSETEISEEEDVNDSDSQLKDLSGSGSADGARTKVAHGSTLYPHLHLAAAHAPHFPLPPRSSGRGML
ncbi:uncharacterized protein LOC119411562 [Nematolebias whitei]|uniref:uncharacterized protein LOC119411562 n=1 Tax=Nematolebias whitei TaxID=451745 RepID=UPI001898850F|nr:uncharacterized protein LOC119411562 [Nematolebias whitei]